MKILIYQVMSEIESWRRLWRGFVPTGCGYRYGLELACSIWLVNHGLYYPSPGVDKPATEERSLVNRTQSECSMDSFCELWGGHFRVQYLLQAIDLIDRRLGPSVCKTSWLDRHSLVISEPTPRQLATNFPRRDKTSPGDGDSFLLLCLLLEQGGTRVQLPGWKILPLSLDSPSIPGRFSFPCSWP